ncbi:MAG: two-component sensor histidine kinase [Burkholderiales bacterium]|nr:two-component sensor histidine kinase [Burkholderiales bacterium]
MLLLFALALLAGVWGFTIVRLATDRSAAIDDANRDVRNYARTFEEHIHRTIQSADQAVLFVRHAYADRGMRLDLADLIGTGVIPGNVFNLVSVVDEHSEVVLSSQPFRPGMSLADREHVNTHFAGDTGRLFVSKPVLGRVSGKWSMQMTRRINRADGSFGGVVVVSMDPFYFTRFYREVNLGSRGLVALVGEDGIVRARQSGGDASLGQNVSEGELFKTLRSASSGVMKSRSSTDGVERIVAYRRLEHYPLYVAVGMSTDEVLSGYLVAQRQQILLALVMSAVIVLFAAVLQRTIRRLDGARTAAIAASAAKSEFLANMSHELRTPLNGIMGYAEILEEDLRGRVALEHAVAIRQSGRHLLNLVNDVLDVDRIEAGCIAVNRTPESLAEIVASAAEAHRASAQIKGLQLTTRIEPGMQDVVHVDRTLLIRILNNLLSNAIKFTERGSVAVSAAPAGIGRVAFSVTDTGPGMPEDLRAKIFVERFVQADTSVLRHHEGTGLGLALSRGLADAMGGTIGCESRIGHGTRFVLELPVAADRAGS